MKAVIAAAGTGGHINPGIAIANKIKEKEPDSKIVFIGTGRGLENDLVPRAGYPLEKINAHGIERKLTIENFKNLYATFKSIGEAKKVLENFRPDVLIGMGGYICVPSVIAARKLNIPVVLHESNAFPGIAVKLFKKKANKILVGFEDAKKRLDNAENVVVTGNPIKIKRLNLTETQKNKILASIGLTSEKPLVLVFGGSQGAQSINRSMIEIIVNRKNKDYQIMWAAGPEQYEEIKKQLEEVNIKIDAIPNVKIVPYIYNMEEIMNLSDIIVARSGAMTITEISNLGKPSILIPLPNVSQDHQLYNAKVLENIGAAKIILNNELNKDNLNAEIEKIAKDPKLMKQMGEKALLKSVKDVPDKIYKEIKKIVKK